MAYDTALVLFSGGQDSTTCLAWALSRFDYVETVGFDYRQRHRTELDCRPTTLEALKRNFPIWADRLGDDRLVDLGVIAEISETALTKDIEIQFQANGLPNTLGGDLLVDLIRFETHTCYHGLREQLHEWGYGCGECPACELRKAGYEKYIAGPIS